MRKLFLICIASTGLIQRANAQFYSGISAGYSIPLLAQTIDIDQDVTVTFTSSGETPSTVKAAAVKSSFGSGANGGLLIGYQFSSNFSVELSGAYIASP